MRIDRVSYSKTFPIEAFVNQKIGVELTLNEGDDAFDALMQAKAYVESFNEETMKSRPRIDSTTQTRLLVPHETDEKFEELKRHLETIEFKEDALAYLETTDYKFTIEAKNIINLKQSKHEKAKG